MRHPETRRRLVWRWWGWLLLCVAPLLILGGFFQLPLVKIQALSMPLFILGCLSLFVTLKGFRGYKRALFAMPATFHSDAESAAWQHLARAQRQGFIGAALPAWIGALALCIGLEALAAWLLALASVTIMVLYWLPRQLR